MILYCSFELEATPARNVKPVEAFSAQDPPTIQANVARCVDIVKKAKLPIFFIIGKLISPGPYSSIACLLDIAVGTRHILMSSLK